MKVNLISTLTFSHFCIDSVRVTLISLLGKFNCLILIHKILTHLTFSVAKEKGFVKLNCYLSHDVKKMQSLYLCMWNMLYVILRINSCMWNECIIWQIKLVLANKSPQSFFTSHCYRLSWSIHVHLLLVKITIFQCVWILKHVLGIDCIEWTLF